MRFKENFRVGRFANKENSSLTRKAVNNSAMASARKLSGRSLLERKNTFFLAANKEKLTRKN